MATPEQLQRALINADAAGDTDAARALAAEIQKMRAAPAPEAVEQVGSSLNTAMGGIPRQLGLTARAGLTGLGDAVGIVSNPFASALNLAAMTFGKKAPFGQASQATGALADTLGLPSPETPTERVVQDASRLMAGTGGFGAAGQAAKIGGAGVQKVGDFLSQAMGRQVSSAAGAGLAGGSVKEVGGTPAAQFGASMLGGVAGGMAAGGVGSLSNWLTKPPKMNPQQLDVRIERLLSDQGIKWDAIPAGAKTALRAEVGGALQAGKELNPDSVRRLLDFRTVGATPTRGTVTLDPIQITREKNLAKMAANSGDTELHGLPRIDNANNRALIGSLNQVGGQPIDAMAAGQRVVGTVASRDARMADIESRLYSRARDSAGRSAPLDRGAFTQQAFDNLARDNKGAFLPAEVESVLNQISVGEITKNGKTYPVPFDVDAINSLKTTLATASRGAKDGNVRAAIKSVRSALEDTPIAAADGSAIPAQSMRAFDRARKVSAGRFGWQESAPGIEAAVGGAAPDQFVKKFIMSDAASFGDVTKLAKEVQRDPQAQAAVRSSIVGLLKDKALSGASDEIGSFSQSAYNRAFSSVERKLPLFFQPEEIEQLKAIGRVASYTQVQPRGSAVNNSNTAAMLGGRALDMVAGGSKFLPLGKALVGDPLQSIRLSIGNSNAANVFPSLLTPVQSTPMTQTMLTPGLLTMGLLAAPQPIK